MPAAYKLALESIGPLNVERLVNGYVRNAHRLITWKINLQRLVICPGDNLTAIMVMDLAFQTALHIMAQFFAIVVNYTVP
jgi:hypothetical protein